jgi:tetratricopeptide (TPR) repeat protein
MPSLQALREFKSSFGRIAGEERARTARNLPPDELALPNHEPAVLQPETAAAGTSGGPEDFADLPASDAVPAEQAVGDSGDFINFDLGDLLGSSGPSLDLDNIDNDLPAPDAASDSMGDFLDTIPNDISAAEPAEGIETLTEGAEEPAGDFSGGFPEGLINGLADEIETERAETGNDSANAGDNGFNLDDLSDFSIDSTETEGATGDSLDLGGDFDPGSLSGFPADETEAEGTGAIPSETGGGTDFSFDDMPDFSNGETEAESPGEIGSNPDFEADLDLDGASMDIGEDAGKTDALPGDDFDLDSLNFYDEAGETGEVQDTEEIPTLDDGEPDSEITEVPEAEAGEDSFDFSFNEGDIEGGDDGFDLGGESLNLDASVAAGEGDSFDTFNLDSDTAENFNLGGGFDAGTGENGFGDEFGTLEEFSLSGIDGAFSGKTPGAAPGGVPVPEGAYNVGEILGEAEAEEIQLTDDELAKFQETLRGYPLNLRIACEQLIAEEAVAPDLMSKLVKLLIGGAPARETAALAGKILGKTIPIPKGFEKKTGQELEAEQASFAYIVVHNFLPVLRLFALVAMAVFSLGYLGYTFIYLPLKAESIYERGYERIGAGEYGRANDLFKEAFAIHQKKDWFYRYARAFRDERQYIYAEEKYDELLYYTAAKNKKHIPEKAAVLEYADMETNYLRNYAKADSLLRHNILDYSVWDREALLALGDNNLAWGEIEPARLEDAREAYAKFIERYGRSDAVLERMLKYFIRTDNLGETLSLKSYFMASSKRQITAASLAELGGYLIDKRTEEIRGVPNEYLDSIEGIRDILLRAVRTDPRLPEAYYHLSRYYEYFNNPGDERLTIERAIAAFDAARQETPRRLGYRIDAHRRYAGILINNREFFPAEEQLLKGVNLYEDGLSRRVLSPSPEYGKLYAGLGDLEYFVKDGDMQTALDYYSRAEQSGYAPPEILYRMGAANYQLRRWLEALNYLFTASSEMPFNRRILYALGNVSYMRGNYYAAQGYYDRLLEILQADRSRYPLIMPTENKEQLELAERLMTVQNNMGVVLEALAERTGSNAFRSRAEGLFSESERAWDILTRNPDTMIRMRPSPDITAPGVNPAYLNIQNSLHPIPGYEPQFFLRIDKDILEPSPWEELAPPAYRLSEGLAVER